VSELEKNGGTIDLKPADVAAEAATFGPPKILPAVEVPPPMFRILSLDELLAIPSPGWCVRRVIRKGEFVVVYGESSSGKTFAVLDLVLKIASGAEWWSYPTTLGGVLYLAGEGGGGLKTRIQAWATSHTEGLGVLKAPVRVLPQSVMFMDDNEFKRLIVTLAAEETQPAVVVIDTLARYMIGGDENSAKDMGIFIARCEKIREVTKATIAVIHHKGKDSRVERGSSALRGAADVMIEVKRNGFEIELKGDKAKDADLLKPIYIKSRSVCLGFDLDGEIITSLVLDEREAPDEATSREEAAAKYPGIAIRQALATLFAGQASGPQLRDATGLKKTPFYDALEAEIHAGYIETVGKGRYPKYALTPKAPEFGSPSPSSRESANSQQTPGAESRESESEFSGPLKGPDSNSNSNSLTHDESSPQQEKQPETAVEPGTAIRTALATLFRGSAAAGALLSASGLKPNAYYAALKREVDAHRIETVAKGPATNYRLTPDAPEYVAPEAALTPQQKKHANYKRKRRGRKQLSNPERPS
jgi:hypothetical protein